jgi:hypothetical protein
MIHLLTENRIKNHSANRSILKVYTRLNKFRLKVLFNHSIHKIWRKGKGVNSRNLICPISDETINKSASRIGAIMTTMLLGIYAFTGNIFVLVFVLYDFVIRVFASKYTSPLGKISLHIDKALRVGNNMINKGPKLFAWRLGLLFTFISFIFLFINPQLSILFAVILMVFSFLDGAFNLCVGCLIYTHIILPFYSSERRKTFG